MTNNIKRLTSGFSALALILGNVVLPAGQAWADGDEPFCIDGGECYATLQEAFDVAPTDGTLTKIYLDSAESVVQGGGAKLLAGQNVEFDLKGKTYDISHNTVGSAGTETNAFQLLKGSTFVIRNGAVTGSSANAKIWVQNYATTTLEDVVLDATNYNQAQYVASNNFGSLTVKGDTQIIANTNGVAFDLWYGMSAVYDDGVTVTFGSDFTGRVEGNVEYGRANRVTDENWRDKAQLNIANGTFDITLVDGSAGALEGANINISGGKFTALDESYVTEDKMAYFDGGTETYTVAAKPTVSGLRSNYNVRAGQQVELGYTLTPEIAGNWIDVYSTEENDLCGESEILTNCIDFNAETKTLSVNQATTVGVHHMEYFLADSTKGNFTLTVLPRGELSVESKTVYVNTAGKIPTYTWAELGVDAEGDGITGEPKNGGVWVDVENKTVEVYDDAEVTWSYDGEVKGKTTFVTYYVYDYSESTVYGVKVGSKTGMGTSYDGVTVEIEDKTIAEFVTEKSTYYSDGKEYTHEELLIHGLKSGTTYVKFVAPNGETVKRTLLEVFDYETTLQHAQAVGTSQTFTITPDKGYKVKELYVSAAGMWDDEGNEVADGPVEYTVNKDGSYTIKVKKMPTYMDCVREEEEEYECVLNEKGEETMVEKISPMLWVEVEIADAAGNTFYDSDSVSLFEFDVKDEVSEEVEGEEAAAVSNEKALTGYTAEIVGAIFSDEELKNSEKPVVIELSDGKTYAVIEDVKGFVEAVMNGEKIVTTLTAPEEIKEVDATEEKALKEELAKASETVEGFRFVNIEVLLTSGDKTFGRITEMDEALKLAIDVSDDEPVAEGMVRRYYVVRYHDGIATSLEAEYDEENKIVTTESDRFSTYLIAYTDTPEIPKAPDTGIVKD